MITYCFYNPKTNHLITNRETAPEDYIKLGRRKIAQAFTTVSESERPKLYLAMKSDTYGFNLDLLNSKIRHKLKRKGIVDNLTRRYEERGVELLRKIKAKK